MSCSKRLCGVPHGSLAASALLARIPRRCTRPWRSGVPSCASAAHMSITRYGARQLEVGRRRDVAGRGLRASLQLKMVVEGDVERAAPGRPRCRTASTDRQGARGLEMTLLRGAAGTHGRTTRNLIPHRSPMCRHAWPIRRDCEDALLSATHGAQGHSAFGRHPRERSPRQPSALRPPPRRERRGDGTVAIRRVL